MVLKFSKRSITFIDKDLENTKRLGSSSKGGIVLGKIRIKMVIFLRKNALKI